MPFMCARHEVHVRMRHDVHVRARLIMCLRGMACMRVRARHDVHDAAHAPA